ncbi:translation initiation factor IF-2 [Desulfosarcina ovata]|uniref:Translation initiation factor IF-2 n=1 Tax=Desulfosarcina ovata subsp. ovata TaxID=2752305 RepID=A0A5K8AH59_9BACT|nr:translation initiation factor IF-2 [Desulfosarcina ovata subsp. ovata]
MVAKIRVYEFARDLNMTNRELLDKIRDLDIEVNSHMSSLDEDVVAKIKSALFGEKDDQLEEKRVRPTVIRRRKIATPQENDVQQAASVSESEPEPPPAEPEEDAPAAVTAEAKPEPKPVVKKAKPVEVAKIISRPEPEVPEDAPPVEPEAETEPGPEPEPEMESVSEPEPPVAEAEELPVEPPAVEAAPPEIIELDEPSALTASEDDEPSAVTQAAAPPAEETDVAPSTDEEAADAPKAEAPVKVPPAKAKKVKKDTPAKIIKLPTKPAVSLKPSGHPTPTGGQATPYPAGPGADETSSTTKDKKKKGWRKKEAVADDGRGVKRKGGLRKKEIVEGAALYTGKMRGRKGRKGSKLKSTPVGQKTQITTAKAIKRRVKVDETIVLSELAKRMGIKANEMIVKLMGMGVMATVNQTIDYETAVLVAGEFNYEVEKASFEEEVILKKTEEENPDQLQPRPPVVTIMGHVDHGKTSLLDVIRKTRVTEGEAGGITQHIGAYHVQTEKGVIAFLDTPGHEAFSAMRSRGAKVTDIVVLVVAADDGVMPQTVEAINHSKASGVPIIVAINKMDKPDADPDRVQRELSEHGLMPESWGGDAIFVQVSAKKNTGIDELLEMILLQAEILELKANPDKLASGHVVEAKLDSGRGPVATVLVQDGTLRAGDSIVCGMHYGKIRVLQDDLGRTVESAGPSMPVEIVGLSGVPMAGDELVALADEKDARQVSQHRMQKQRSKELAKTNRLSLEGLFEKMQQGEVKDLNLIIKADVDGSIEALRDSLVKLSNDEVSINVVHAATGTITESDIFLAANSNAIIIGFNVRPNAKVQDLAAEENVDMRFHNVIYNVIKEVKDSIVGMMESIYEERVLGRAEVRQTFHVPKVGTIAGCYVTDGKMQRGQLMRLLRDGIITYEGKNSSLRRFKDDVKEVQSGYECGIGIENFNDIKIGDVIESYFLEEIRPEVE